MTGQFSGRAVRAGWRRGAGVLAVAAGTAAGLSAGGRALAGVPTQTVLLSGETAPGQASSVKVNFFNQPHTTSIDNDGNVFVLYSGFPYIPAPNVRDTLIVGNRSAWTQLARANDPATEMGVSGATWRGFTPTVVRSRSGRTLFGAVLQGPGIDNTVQGPGNNSGVLMYHDGSSLSLVARNLDQVPGLAAGTVYYGLDGGTFAPTVNMNASGQMLINTYLRGTGIVGSSENAIVFRDTNGTVTPVAQELRPSGIPNTNFQTIDGNRLNSAGRYVFRSTLVGAPGHPFDVQPGVDDFSMWTGTGGSGGPSLLARGNSAIPGMAGRVWGNFSGAPGINDAGQVAFRGTMRGTGITETVNDLALFRMPAAGGTPTIMAQKGVQAPGTEAGTTFLQMGDPLLAPNGDAVFSARLQGPSVTSNVNEYALFAYRGSSATPLARQNSQAAGLPAGVLYDSMFDAQVNALGHVAFTSTLKGAGVTDGNNKAIFAEIAGVLTEVVREGEQIEVSPGVFRTVAALGQSGLFENTPPNFPSAGAEDGLSRMWNDSDKLVFWAQFTDGSSGIFVAPPIPAPGAGLALGLGIVAWGRRRR